MSGKSLHKRITINAAANLLRYLIYIVITFTLTPFIISHLGNSQYGLWVVILSVIGYSGLLEMGIQTAIIKLVAQYNGADNAQKVNEVIVTALIFFIAVGFFTAAVCWFVLPHYLQYFLKETSEILLAKKLLYIMGFNLSFIFIGYVFGGMIYGLQMYHVKGFIDVAMQVVNAILIYLLFTSGYGLAALAKIKIVVDLLSITCSYVVCTKIFPKLELKINHANRVTFKELFNIGGKIFTSTTLARIATNIEPFIITFYLTTAWTAIFSVPKRLIDYLREIVWSLSTGFMPTFSELHGKNSLEMIRSVYIRYTRYILIVMLPIIISTFIYGVPFVGLWVGQEYAVKGKYAMLFLTASFFVECSQPLLGRLLIAVDKINVFVRISAYSSILYLLLCTILVYFYGIAGVALSALVVSLVSQLYYLKSACKYLGMPITTYLCQSYIIPFSIAIAYGALMYVLSINFAVKSYTDIVVQISISFLLYVLLTFIISLNLEERNYLKHKIRDVFQLA